MKRRSISPEPEAPPGPGYDEAPRLETREAPGDGSGQDQDSAAATKPARSPAKRKLKTSGPALSGRRLRMLKRKNEIYRLIALRRAYGVLSEHVATQVHLVLADAIRIQRHHGGFDAVKLAGDTGMSIEEARFALLVLEGHRKGGAVFTDKEAGQHLDLRKDERREADITTMVAIDETPAEREEYVREGKRKDDRDRAAAKRRQAGIKPRPEGPRSNVQQECDRLGISRATYYRAKREGRLPEISTQGHFAKRATAKSRPNTYILDRPATRQSHASLSPETIEAVIIQLQSPGAAMFAHAAAALSPASRPSARARKPNLKSSANGGRAS